MPTINMSSIELLRLQTLLRNHEQYSDCDLEIPEAPRDPEELVDADEAMDVEDAMHEVGAERALWKLVESCPVCGELDCDEDVDYVGPNPIHKSDHPEVKAERAMDNQRRY